LTGGEIALYWGIVYLSQGNISMPRYEYLRDECQVDFEKLVSFSEKVSR
jgi:hypothetical protein